MAAPNLKSPTTVIGKTIGYAVTASMATALSNGASSGKVFKINSIYCANIDGVNSAEITLEHYNGTTAFKIGNTITVPADGTQILVARDSYIYLEEGQSLRAQASAANDLELVISYEEIT